jgi:prepilin-type N-terminal cleavage/methylation domain-containing protein
MVKQGIRTRHGFTLIELVVATVIISVLAVASAPFFVNTPRQRLSVARHELATHLKLAREMAVSTQRTTWVEFDTDLDRYTVYIENPTTPGRSNRLYATHPAEGGQFVVELGTGASPIRIASASFGGRAEVEFLGSGAPANGQGVQLTSSGTVQLASGDATQEVSVVPGTGYVRETP